MTNFLDVYPQDWSNPQYEQLRDLLVDCATQQGKVVLKQLAERAGILAGTFPEDYDNVRTTSEELIKVLGLQRKLRALVEVAAEEELFGPEIRQQFAGMLGGGLPDYTPLPPPDPKVLPDPRPDKMPPGYRIPHDRNANFTGREGRLKALAKALLFQHADSTLITQAVRGTGGIGKTQLAVEFAYRYGRFFHGVHWLNCEEAEAINAEIAACGGRMRLRPWPRELPDQVERTLDAWGEDGHRHLVILDNLEKVEPAREWLRRLRPTNAALLITARRSHWPTDLGLEPMAINVFTKTESRRFLRNYLPAKRAKVAALDDLAQRLGHLPLALELAGRYLAGQSTLSLATYLNNLTHAFDHPSMKAWNKNLGNPTGHDLDLRRTFALSWEQVEEEAACRLFRVAGYCAPNQPIPCDLLAAALDLDEETCAVALGQLSGLGLLDLADPHAGPTIHPFWPSSPVPCHGRKAMPSTRCRPSPPPLEA